MSDIAEIRKLVGRMPSVWAIFAIAIGLGLLSLVVLWYLIHV